MPTGVAKEDVVRAASSLGIDLIGFASCSRLEGQLPEEDRPSRLAPHFPTLIVLVKRTYLGLTAAHHGGTRQFWGGRFIKQVDSLALGLVRFLEERGLASLPLSSLSVDLGRDDGRQLCPAGQGSRLLKAAAVEAGLGTLGLNGMLLTRAFGPRLVLSGVLTKGDFPPGAPLQEELCLGLEECGRCAAVCPQEAIPRRALRGAPLASYRDLDREACQLACQPLGPRELRRHMADILASRSQREALWAKVGSRLTGAFWQEMIMIKEGTFTACSECVNICPVGRDYELFLKSHPDPAPPFRRRVEGDWVEIENVAREGREGQHG